MLHTLLGKLTLLCYIPAAPANRHVSIVTMDITSHARSAVAVKLTLLKRHVEPTSSPASTVNVYLWPKCAMGAISVVMDRMRVIGMHGAQVHKTYVLVRLRKVCVVLWALIGLFRKVHLWASILTTLLRSCMLDKPWRPGTKWAALHM
jgi:hypothetical protein